MNLLMSIIYPILCIFTPSIIYQVVVMKSKNHNKKISKKHFVWVYIFLIYLFLCLTTAGIGSIWEIGRYESIIRIEEINFIPFSSEGMMTYILNIIMFMPLGFLLPLVWKNMRKLKPVVVTGLVYSFSIEICQLFNRRNTDVDDLLMNVIGSIIGFFIYKSFVKLIKRKNKEEKDFSLSKNEPIVYLTLSILGIFFLYKWNLFI